MPERYTIRDATRAFERLCETFGRKQSREFGIDDPRREGTWELDYNPTYGGCVVEEIIPSSPPREGDDRPQTYTAVTMPFGYARKSPREFCEFVNGIITGADLARE